jgi:hypothetical protein
MNKSSLTSKETFAFPGGSSVWKIAPSRVIGGLNSASSTCCCKASSDLERKCMSSTQACDQARNATDEVTIYPTYIEERTPSLRITPECSACLGVIRSTCCCPVLSPSRREEGPSGTKPQTKMPIHHRHLQCSAQIGEGRYCVAVRCLRERGGRGGSGHAADPLNLIAFDPREVSLVGEIYAATMELQC